VLGKKMKMRVLKNDAFKWVTYKERECTIYCHILNWLVKIMNFLKKNHGLGKFFEMGTKYFVVFFEEKWGPKLYN